MTFALLSSVYIVDAFAQNFKHATMALTPSTWIGVTPHDSRAIKNKPFVVKFYYT